MPAMNGSRTGLSSQSRAAKITSAATQNVT